MAESIFAKKVQRDGNFAKFLQRKVSLQDSRGSAQAGKLVDNRAVPLAKNPNNTGLPDNLKSGIEHLSGMSMDHVRVHYNSSQPAQLNALAYAQGSNIHVAPGQEKHLPHEAWHVVQQAQGRVKPTMQAKGVAINDNQGLEREADAMGARALTGGQCRSPVAQLGGTGRRRKIEGLGHYISGSPTHGLRAISVAQLVTEEEIATSLRNIAAYAPNTLQHYGEATIRAVLNARNFRVRGHASGGSGDAQNAATTQDLETLTEYLQAYHPPSEEHASSSSSSGGRTGARHTEEEEKEASVKKADKKKEKAAKKKAAYEASQDPFGKKRNGGGGGGGGKRGGSGGGIGVPVK